MASGKRACCNPSWLLVHVLRHLGLAARFMSAYLIQLTTALWASDRRKPYSAGGNAALSQHHADFCGYYGHAKTEFSFDMQVRRIAETAHITKPFSDKSWGHLNALGQAVDEVLNAHDVKLTFGGNRLSFRSTFRSRRMEHKRGRADKTRKADTAIRRLLEGLTPGGFALQTKWYPGESLPR